METVSISRQLLNATDGGLTIFKKYLKSKFELDQVVTVGEYRFKVTLNSYYGNYAIYIDLLTVGGWVKNYHRFNAIWFVKELYCFEKQDEALSMIDREMNLGIIHPKKVELTSAQEGKSRLHDKL